jgi:hypothetical protein
VWHRRMLEARGSARKRAEDRLARASTVEGRA